MKYVLPQELKSETKVAKFIYLQDFFFIIAYFLVMLMFEPFINNGLVLAYRVFNGLIAVGLCLPSSANPGKRMYSSILFMLKKDRTVYKPISVRKDVENDVIQGHIKSES